MNYKEIIAQTGCVIKGLCKGVQEYVGEKKTFYSVDLELRGTRQPLNVRLPDGYPRQNLKEYELVTLPVCFKPTFDRKGIMVEAVL